VVLVVGRGVGAAVVPNGTELARLRSAIPGVAMTVCLLTASEATLRRRLGERDLAELTGRRARVAAALQDEMTESGIADFEVSNDDDADLSAVAAEVLRCWARTADAERGDVAEAPT
jgi:hypothetical protein